MADSQRTTDEADAPVEPDHTVRLDRGAPGDRLIDSDAKSPEQREFARRKSQFYGDAFAHRESISSARERISREAVVMAEVRTNVIVCGDLLWTQ